MHIIKNSYYLQPVKQLSMNKIKRYINQLLCPHKFDGFKFRTEKSLFWGTYISKRYKTCSKCGTEKKVRNDIS